MSPFLIKPIGIFHGSKTSPLQAPRQASLDSDEGRIELLPGQNFEQALEDLEGFSHLWVIYLFHHNCSWKLKVSPPRGGAEKRGVFATRSPYRPNPIGLSVVEIKSIQGRQIFIKGHDLLDQTPIIDLKPYIAYADSFPGATLGWLDGIENSRYEIRSTPQASEKLEYLQHQGLPELWSVVCSQLEFEPTNTQKKRVRPGDSTGELWIFSYRTWRLKFKIENQTIQILDVFSGYSETELIETSDPVGDKGLHRSFTEQFKSAP